MTPNEKNRTAIAVLVATFLVVGTAAVATDATRSGDEPPAQATTTTVADQRTAVSITNLSAPDRVRVGTDFTVAATLVNRGNESAVRRVVYRIVGNVIAARLVHVPADAAMNVAFDVTGADTDGFPTGTFTHGVFTHDAEATADLTLAPDEGTTTAEATTRGPRAASITFEEQSSNGTGVTVRSVTVPRAGFVVVHDTGIVRGNVTGSMLGVSGFLEAGTHRNVTVRLDEQLNESQRLVAIAYRDSNDNREFDFLASRRTADGPYTLPGEREAVNEIASVTIETENETTASGR